MDGEGRGRRALAAQTALGEGEQGVFVSFTGNGLFNGQVGLVVIVVVVDGRWAGRWDYWLMLGIVVVLLGGRLLDGKRARRGIDGVPQARGRLARGAVVKRAQGIQVEDAVGERPAGRKRRRRLRRSGGEA